MARIGIHTSIAGSFALAAERAHVLRCNTFQIFSSNPRQWHSHSVSARDARDLDRLRQRHDLYPLAIHANYLINLASEDAVIRPRSITAFRAEIERAIALDAEYLILHPGSVKNGDRGRGVTAVVAGLEESARYLRLARLRILIENTAGGGGSLGCDLAEVAAIVHCAGLPMGCCLDTAHSFEAGFDLSGPAGLSAWVARIRETVGFGAVHVIHTNDSRTPLGSRRDRHEHIGKGYIGRAGFRALLNHPDLREKAFILETPIDQEGDDRRNLSTVRRLMEDHAGKAL